MLTKTDAVVEESGPSLENSLASQVGDSVGRSIASIVKRIEALDAEKAQLLDQLRAAQERVQAEFGKYKTLLAKGPANGGASGSGRRKSDPDKTCPVCGEKGHDARRHKSGVTNKKGND